MRNTVYSIRDVVPGKNDRHYVVFRTGEHPPALCIVGEAPDQASALEAMLAITQHPDRNTWDTIEQIEAAFLLVGLRLYTEAAIRKRSDIIKWLSGGIIPIKEYGICRKPRKNSRSPRRN